VKIAATGDLHCRVNSGDEIRNLLHTMAAEADVLTITGDLTDNGMVEEADTLLEQLKGFHIPILTTLGNHDHQNGKAGEIVKRLVSAGVEVLDGTSCEIDGVGFIGTKGFCGGFGKDLVQPFGESALKSFIQVGIDEAAVLENSLKKLTSKHKMAILHYAPIPDTLVGESPQIYPFLGSGRLADALDRYPVDVIVHGHAHNGSPHGKTPGGIPVHNVSRFVQARNHGRPYLIIQL
jgi:Icc-related predicted phosphoesterase